MKKRQNRYGIRYKFTLLICLVVALLMAIGTGIGYFQGFNLLKKTTSEYHREIANFFAGSIAHMIDEKIEQLRTFVTDRVWKDAIIESNVKYETMQDEAIQQYLLEMDYKWTIDNAGSLLLNEYLEKETSAELKELLEEENDFAEIFLTDRAGGLVAFSRRTNDFFHADEMWWQEAFNNGKGKIFIGDVEFDESSNVYGITIAVPIKDTMDRVIGICKGVVNVEDFFEPLGGFHIGKTGHIALVNDSGYIIAHLKDMPLSKKIMDDKDFLSFSKEDSGKVVITSLHVGKKSFLSMTEVKHPLLTEKGISWKVFVDQEAKEVFVPLNTLILQAAAGIATLMLVLIPIGFIASGIFVRPIKKLRNEIEHIGRGNLDYKVEIETNDEIEELADSFNQMTANLKKTTTSIDNLNREIAERKRIERILVEGEAKYKGLTEASPDCIKLFDTKGGLLFINNGGLKEHRLHSIEQAKEYDFRHSIIEEDRGKFKKAFEDALKGRVSSIEIRHTQDGSTRETCLESVVPIKDNEGKTISIFGVSRDITEIKKLEELKDALTQMIVHDLRNPLGILLQSVQFLQSDPKHIMSKEQKEVLSFSYGKIMEMKKMISDLLDISKMEEGKFVLDREQIDITAFLKELVNGMNILAQEKKLSTKIPSDIPKFNADKQILKRIISNLIGNAFKFAAPGSTIEIRTSYDEKGKNILVSVKNEGEGIPEEYKDKVFNKFVQVQDKQVGKNAGKGLGLTFCKMAVEAHGGRIWVESEAGKGATFNFTIPLK